MYQTKNLVFLLKAVVTILVLQGCSKMTFSDIARNPASEAAAGSNTATGNEDPIPALPVKTEEVLKSIRPTLAVRGISCLLCHAQIHSSVITDFGYGTANYLGGTGHFYNKQSWYNDLAGTWQSAHIDGSVYVPDATITRDAQNVFGQTYTDKPLIKIVELMTTPMEVTWKNYLTPEETHAEMAYNVIPVDGLARVIAKSKVVIRAPAEAEIRALAPNMWSEGSSASAFGRINSPESVQFQISASGKYTMNQDVALECAMGDIVVKGTLYLKNLKVKANDGCRLYVTGTVFIEGPIAYVGGGSLQNLQITSASAIIMGINSVNVKNRLINDSRGLTLEGRDYTELATQVVAEAQSIENLADAGDVSPRRAIDFDGLLLNAPIVHSRYLGNVKGTVIAEAALFSVGQFHFTFDPVFTQVNVLPLITRPVLSVQ